MKRAISLILLLVMLVSVLPLGASAATTDITPYARLHAEHCTKAISMGGNTYTDGIEFEMGYNGMSDGYIGEITYNLKKQYSSFSFDAGYLRGHQRNAAITVIADGKIVVPSTALNYKDIAKHFTVNVKGVEQLVIHLESSAYDKTWYAIGDITLTPVGTPSNPVIKSDPHYNDRLYQKSQYTSVYTGEFTMGGNRYQDGYKFRIGYNWCEQVASMSFNFKGQYTKMSFDIGRYLPDNETYYTRSALLTIEVDGVPLPEYNNRKILWNDLVLPVSIDLKGKSQVNITLDAHGYDVLEWAIGNVQISPDIHPEDKWTTIPGTTPTCKDTGLTEGKKCSVCGVVTVKQETIPATGKHTEVIVKGTPATCGKTGLTDGKKCSVCGTVTVKQNTIKATGKHTYSGAYDPTCDVCGFVRSIPMFRMYDPNAGEHFYTGSAEEREILVKAGWNYEGVGFNFPASGSPVHRLYHEPTGEHLYTMSEEEKTALLAQGWSYEGVAFNSAGKDEVPQYRLHNPNATRGAYHFTSSAKEKQDLMNAGWEYQGIGWYSCLK